jgi:hypothetical protein
MKKILLLALVFALAITIAVPSPVMAHSRISTILTMAVEQVGVQDFVLTILETNDSPYWKDDPDLRDVWVDLQPLGYVLVKGDSYYVGGDTDDDGLLDAAHTELGEPETWKWVVPVTVTGPTTFVAIGHGITYDGWDITYDPDAAWPWPNGPIAHDAEERAEVTVDVPQLFSICGYKFLAGTEEGLGGWQINLYVWDDSLEPADWVLIATATTDEYGKYCFSNLEAGDYKVTETLKEGWVQVSPAGNEHLVTLPGGASDCETGPFYNFENEREKVCYDETAWAYGGPEEDYGAEGDVAKHNNKIPGITSDAWGWTNYFDGETEFPVVMDLWAGAGQNDTTKGFKVGTVTVEVDGDCVTVTYEIDEGYSMTEAHLWVGDTPLPLIVKKGIANPTSAPGQFPFSPGEEICGVDVEAGFWVAAHAVIEWCEVVCP